MTKDRLNQQLDEISELIKRTLETKDVAGLAPNGKTAGSWTIRFLA